jgi:hypothetical protein
MTSIAPIRLEDLQVHELQSGITVLTLKVPDKEHVPILSESLEEGTRTIIDGKITIDVLSGSEENVRFDGPLNLQSILPSSSELVEAEVPAPDPNGEPIVYHTFSVSPEEWDGLLEDLLRIKLIPL